MMKGTRRYVVTFTTSPGSDIYPGRHITDLPKTPDPNV